jgi:hypothetical protein
MSSRKIRVKKLNHRTILPILLESQIDASEYESLTTDVQLASGVEANEADVSLSSPFPLRALRARATRRF